MAIAVVAPYLAPVALAAIGVTATATAVAIATAVIGLTLSVGLALGMRALGVGTPVQRSPVGPPSVFRQSISESFIVYGKRRVGGLLVFFHPRVSGSNHYRYFVIAVAGHRCNGVVDYMLGDEVVSVDPTSHLVTSGKYANAAWLEFERGDGATLCDLHATFVAECGGKWTNNHIGTDIAKLFAKFKMTDAVVEAGMPNMTLVIEGKDDIVDPRGPTTGYTRNGPLIFYDWMALPREEGGFGAYADEIPDDTFIAAQANVADEVVDGENRYSLDAVIVTGSTPSEIRDVMIVNMAGSYTYSGGKHLMRPGYWVPPSKTLSENDLAGPIQVSPFMAADKAVNEVNGTYVSPEDKYQAMAGPTQSVASDDVRQMDLDLAYTTSPKQFARVARIMLNRAQHEKTVLWPMNIVGLGVKALDTVQLEPVTPADDMRYGLDNYAWQVGNWGLSADYGVVLNLREESEDIYAEPTVTLPAPAPAIGVAERVLTTSEIAALINTSSVVDPDPLTPVIRATETTISIDDHLRRYDDKTVEVLGSAGASLDLEDGDDLLLEDGGFILTEPASSPDITGLSPGTLYHIGYEDLAREGGAVTYVASTSLPAVSNSGAGGSSPGMHYVGTITTAASGSGGTTTGGGAVPPGYNGAGEIL